MHNPESILENKTYSVICDFEIPTDHIIFAKRTELVIVNKKKKTYRIVNFAILAGNGI